MIHYGHVQRKGNTMWLYLWRAVCVFMTGTCGFMLLAFLWGGRWDVAIVWSVGTGSWVHALCSTWKGF